MADWSGPSAPPPTQPDAASPERGRSDPAGAGSQPPTLAGGRILGAFDYTSSGQAGWHVVHRRDLGGLTEDAIAEGSRLIERLPWWPSEPRAAGGDPYQRPRRLAWLGGPASGRRFLVHTIHAENDASNRPDNNYTECLIVGAEAGEPTPDRHPAGQQPLAQPETQTRNLPTAWSTTRPSQLWSLDSWASPWGPSAVGEARPGSGTLTPGLPPRDVFAHIVSEPNGMPRLRTLLRAIHRAIHLGGPPVTGRVDDLVWGAALLDTAISLLPPPAVWEVTFDLRSLAPTGRAASPSHRPRSQAVVMLLGRHDQPATPVPGCLELAADASADSLEAALAESTEADCPRCGLWLTSLDLLLRQSPAPDWDQVAHQVGDLEAGRRRFGGLASGAVPAERPIPGPGTPPGLDGLDQRGPNPHGFVQRGSTQPGLDGLDQRPPTPPAPRGGPPPPAEVAAPSPPAGSPIDLQSLDGALGYLTEIRKDLVGQPDNAQTRARVEQAWVYLQAVAGRELQKSAATNPGMQVHADAPATSPSRLWASRHSRGRNS